MAPLLGILGTWLCLAQPAPPDLRFDELKRMYDYDATQPLDVQEKLLH